jgi:hypothetical protein
MVVGLLTYKSVVSQFENIKNETYWSAIYHVPIASFQVPKAFPRNFQRFGEEAQYLVGSDHDLIMPLLDQAQHKRLLPGDSFLALSDMAPFHGDCICGRPATHLPQSSVMLTGKQGGCDVIYSISGPTASRWVAPWTFRATRARGPEPSRCSNKGKILKPALLAEKLTL